MISDLVDRFEHLNGEWGLVIIIGLLFFLVQIVLCVSVCLRLRRQERAIKRLVHDCDQGVDERLESLPKHAWLQWVTSTFSVRSKSAGNFTRDDALQELDSQIASDGNYLLLQRMGVMAPLLGVVLTVAGFYWLRVGEGDQSLQTILLAVTPLISGVGTGAVLALINQVLLHIVGGRVESLRLAARAWFDATIWRSYRLNFEKDPVNPAQMMEQFIRNTLDDINNLGDKLARAREISAALSALPVELRTVLDHKTAADQKPVSLESSSHFVARLPRTASTSKQMPK